MASVVEALFCNIQKHVVSQVCRVLRCTEAKNTDQGPFRSDLHPILPFTPFTATSSTYMSILTPNRHLSWSVSWFHIIIKIKFVYVPRLSLNSTDIVSDLYTQL